MRVGNMGDWETDPNKLTSGAPLDLGEGRALIVKRAGMRNREFMAAVAGIDAADDAASMSVYARTVVVGWVGITDEHGVDLPYSPDACVELFMAAPEVFDAVWLFASRRANFRAGELAQDREAVKPLSGGTKARARTQTN